MAEAFLEIVLENLNSLIQKELGLFLGFHKDLERLASLFTTIKATLADAEEKQFTDRAIKDWLQKLKDAAHILDDILDECSYEALGFEYQSDKVRRSFLSSSHPKHAVSRYKIAKKMKRINERLEEIAKERTKFHLTEMIMERRSGVIEWRQTTSFITEPRVYGRDKDQIKIVEFLAHDASHSEYLSVYPIVGLGGVGKTTLAQLIFNHERVVNHFELRIWVCVSEDFSLKRITKAIVEEAEASECSYEGWDLQPLLRRLQDLLQSKRYLLILDDVWDEDQENWHSLKSVLAYGAEGASILVTTRLSKVAAIMGTIPPHELSELSDNECWELFKSRAFGPNEVAHAELVVIGKEIVKKCGGVPLAAKALGGLLRFKRERKEWLFVKDSNLWSLPHNENSIMPALRFSYLSLPVKLRQCFAYCAIFPKHTKIRKQYLIELWMTNGFISSNEILDAEEVGDGVWHELYWRSFFQDIERDGFGKVISFKMHDLVHDLAQFTAEEICCITSDNSVNTLSERIHHLSDHRWRNKIQLHRVKSLRTYLLPHRYSDQLSAHVLKCHSLRVLHGVRREELSSSIGHLKHLRYLNLSEGRFKTLPESLCKLWNLQILNLDNCNRLQKLPNSLIRLKALRQLSLNGCTRLLSLPPQIGKLSSLRNLSTYLVGKERGSLLAELGSMKLKGSLHIKNLGKVKSVTDARDANMSRKQLNQLWLSWDINEDLRLEENVQKILEVLQPDTQQLQSLRVAGYKGFNFPEWMSIPSLKYLTYLSLEDCKNCFQLPALGKLPSLKELRIDNMLNVKYIHEEYYDGRVVFTALESLFLTKLPSLIRLSREDGENMFPCLSTLHITQCPKLLNVPTSIQCLTCLQDLCIVSCREVEGLHEALQHITSLKKLRIESLPNLELLPDCFGNLSLLRQLHICNCYKLRCLPLSLSCLSSLKELMIWGCHPELEKRCEKETGEDWPKIAHIPCIEVISWRL